MLTLRDGGSSLLICLLIAAGAIAAILSTEYFEYLNSVRQGCGSGIQHQHLLAASVLN
jgi:hypothetical protein